MEMRFLADSILPFLPIAFVVGGIASVLFYWVASILTGLHRAQSEMRRLLMDRNKVLTQDKAELEHRLFGVMQENDRLWRVHQYDLDRVKAFLPHPGPVVMDNIVIPDFAQEKKSFEENSHSNDAVEGLIE